MIVELNVYTVVKPIGNIVRKMPQLLVSPIGIKPTSFRSGCNALPTKLQSSCWQMGRKFSYIRVTQKKLTRLIYYSEKTLIVAFLTLTFLYPERPNLHLIYNTFTFV